MYAEVRRMALEGLAKTAQQAAPAALAAPANKPSWGVRAIDYADRAIQHPATQWTYWNLVYPFASAADRALFRLPSAATWGLGWLADRGLNLIDKIPGVPSNVITPIRAGLAYHLPSAFSYTPAPITAGNFDDDEQAALLGMLRSNGYRSLDDKAVSRYMAQNKGRGYGSPGLSLWGRVTEPESVVETTLGAAAVRNGRNGMPERVVDTYDFNVGSAKSRREDNMYKDLAGRPDSSAYAKLRSVASKYLPKDTDPDGVKIKSDILIKDLVDANERFYARKQKEQQEQKGVAR